MLNWFNQTSEHSLMWLLLIRYLDMVVVNMVESALCFNLACSLSLAARLQELVWFQYSKMAQLSSYKVRLDSASRHDSTHLKMTKAQFDCTSLRLCLVQLQGVVT